MEAVNEHGQATGLLHFVSHAQTRPKKLALTIHIPSRSPGGLVPLLVPVLQVLPVLQGLPVRL